MDIRMQGRAVNLLYRLFLRNSTNAHQIPYLPAKITVPAPSAGDTPVVSPETVGVPSESVSALLRDLERERDAVLHAFGASRAGRVFTMAAAPGFDTTVRHQTHSLCKTVTGLCIGILIGEGRLSLDDPAYRLVGGNLPPILTPRAKAVTVRHLLSMTAGVMFGEVGAVTEENWVRCFFESSIAFTPGRRFFYNSMNSYILSVIVEEITGMTLASFAAERIFLPLGIRDTLWESCPWGHTKGGWGLYLSIEDMLKLGELILRGGLFGHRRLVPRDWIRQMLKPHATVPESVGDYNYGFHIWVARDRSCILANGMLGQNIWIDLRRGLVLAAVSGNCELFQTGDMHAVVRRFMAKELADGSLRPDRRAVRELRETERSFFRGRTWTHPQEEDAPLRDRALPRELFDRLAHEPYLAGPNNVGILPLFTSLMQNNLSPGLRSLTFRREEGEPVLLLTEGEETYRLPLGFGEYKEATLSVRGEQYLVAVRAEFTDDTDAEPILKLDVLFPEMAAARRIRLYYDTDKPTLVLTEQPGRQMMDALVGLFDIMPRARLLGGIVRSQLEREGISHRIRKAYEPHLRLGRGAIPTATEEPTEGQHGDMP